MDRFGIFQVDFDAQDKPIRADSLQRMIGHRTPFHLVELLEEMELAIYQRATLHFLETVNLDQEEWNGMLYWPRLPVLR